MQMPFTTDQFFAVMREYNTSVWPGQLILYAIGLLTASLVIWKPRHSSFVLGAIALLWGWMAIAYHLMFFTDINPMAYAFAVMFLAEAILIAWYAFGTRRLRFSPEAGRAARGLGLLLIAYALVIYPALARVLSQRYPAIPTFGLPCPTTIFTLGILVQCARPLPTAVLVVPGAWALIATSAAVSFGVGEDYALLPAFVLVVGVLVRSGHIRRRVQAHASS